MQFLHPALMLLCTFPVVTTLLNRVAMVQTQDLEQFTFTRSTPHLTTTKDITAGECIFKGPRYPILLDHKSGSQH